MSDEPVNFKVVAEKQRNRQTRRTKKSKSEKEGLLEAGKEFFVNFQNNTNLKIIEVFKTQ